ncbi:MAG: sulfoxide reductase heme-binding subunit YedZ [Chloroflexi bacterium HGW-Chloroflexi-10]|nr:MAG: sulfoxide reductase heme-binding subunit YedZ [Chloroflexi bacterium HGW-Chloroflexi-10]
MNTKLSTSSIPIIKPRKMAKTSFNWLRILVHGFGLLPLAELFYKWIFNQLTVNPIQFFEQFLGRAALHMLVLSLAVTPLVTLTGWKQPIKHRRALGLYAFFYFALHFLTFAVVDYGLNWREILFLTVEKPFITVGALAGLILLALAFTSFKFWMKRLGKNWSILHKTVYLAGGLVVLHYAWAIKGSVTTLSGDIVRPLIMGILVLFLLVLRIPVVKRWVISIRKRIW